MLLLGLLYCCVIVSSTYTYDVPLAVWSGKDYITGSNVGVSTSISSIDAGNMLRSFILKEETTEGALSQYLHLDQMRPEVLVLFTEAQLRSEQLSTYAADLLKFRNILSSSASSLQAPFVDMRTAFDSNIVNIVNSIQEVSGKVFYFGKGTPLLNDILSSDEKTVSSSRNNLEETLKRHSQIFSNGKTDLIIVYLSSMTASKHKFTQTDETISEVHNYISSRTNDYVSVYTGLAYDNPEYNMEFGSDERRTVISKRYISGSLQSGNNTNNQSNATVPIFRQYFGGWFWELFVTMIIMIPLLIIGTYAINSIQTPLFEAKKKN